MAPEDLSRKSATQEYLKVTNFNPEKLFPEFSKLLNSLGSISYGEPNTEDHVVGLNRYKAVSREVLLNNEHIGWLNLYPPQGETRPHEVTFQGELPLEMLKPLAGKYPSGKGVGFSKKNTRMKKGNIPFYPIHISYNYTTKHTSSTYQGVPFP